MSAVPRRGCWAKGIVQLVGLVLATLALATAWPSLANGATVAIGNDFSSETTTDSTRICANNPCTVLQLAQPGGPLSQAAPVSGTVTSWRYRSGQMGDVYELEVLHPMGGGSFAVSARSPQVTVPDVSDTVKTVTLTGGLPIQAGDRIGLHFVSGAGGGVPVVDSASSADELGSRSPDFPGLAEGAGGNQQLLVQATISSSEGGGGGTGTTPPPPPPPPSAALSSLTPSAPAGRQLLFSAASSDLHGAAALRYSYVFPGGGQASCSGSQPVLGATFNAAVSGAVSMTVTTAAGTSAPASVPFSVTAAVRKTGKSALVGRSALVAYSCSSTTGKAPIKSKYNKLLVCLEPSDVKVGYVDVRGCLSEVSLSEIPEADRRTIPFKGTLCGKLGCLHTLSAPEVDTTGDVFWVAFGQVKVNGLVLVPPPGHPVILSVAAFPATMLQSGDVFISAVKGSSTTLTRVGVGGGVPVTSSGTYVHWNAGPVGDPNPGGNSPVGQIDLSGLAHALPEPFAWLAGTVVSQAEANRTLAKLSFEKSADGDYITNVPIALQNLPFGSLLGRESGLPIAVAMQTDNPTGLQVSDFCLGPLNAFFGPVRLQNLVLEYSRPGGATSCGKGSFPAGFNLDPDSLSGTVQTPIYKGLLTVRAVVADISHAPRLKTFHADYEGNIDIVPPFLELTKAVGDLNVDTKTLELFAHISALGGGIEAAGNCGVAGINGFVNITTEPFDLLAQGAPEVLCIQPIVAPGDFFHIDKDGSFTGASYVNFVLPTALSIVGSLKFEGDPTDLHIRADGNVSASAGLFGLGGDTGLGAQAIISDQGAALCSSVSVSFLGFSHTFSLGVGAKYDPRELFGYPGGALAYLASHFGFKADGCNVNDYSDLPPTKGLPGERASAAGHAAATGGYSFEVARGEQTAVVLLHGSGGAPAAILRAPGGQTITATSSGPAAGHALVARIGASGETEVQIAGPEPGRWTVESAPGSAPILEAKAASQPGPPSIRARVRGAGARRTLTYTEKNIPKGTTVRFYEQGNGGAAPIGTARGVHGTIHFTPSDAKRGPRTILAFLIAKDGTPRPTLTVTRYTAAPPRPGRARAIVVRRHGSTLLISFRPGAGATSQTVAVRLSDGRGQVFFLAGKARTVSVRFVPRGVHAAVTVQAERGGLTGLLARGHGG